MGQTLAPSGTRCGALRVALRVVAIVTVAGAGPALLVPRVPTKFWYLGKLYRWLQVSSV